MMMANLATELIRHGRVRTTLARAKGAQPLAERMITFGKRGDVHARRQVLRVIRDRDVVHKLFSDVGPAFAQRGGGYTRVLKLGARKGDAAPMALLELVEGVEVAGVGELAEQPRRRWSLRRRRGSTLSTTARESAEERQAAVDRGEDVDVAVDPEGSGDMAEAVPAGSLEAADDDSPDRVQADPAEVEARLAAQDSELDGPAEDDDDGPITDAPVPAEEQDAPSEERLPDATDPEDRG